MRYGGSVIPRASGIGNAAKARRITQLARDDLQMNLALPARGNAKAFNPLISDGFCKLRQARRVQPNLIRNGSDFVCRRYKRGIDQ